MEVIIKNVRCFKGEQTIPLGPLTILVGENSTGKTTFLSILSCLSDPDSLISGSGLNRAPYELGGYRNIARFNQSTGRYVKSFTLGFSTDKEDKLENLKIQTTFIEDEGKIIPSKYEMSNDHGRLVLLVKPQLVTADIFLEKVKQLSITIEGFPREGKEFAISELMAFIHIEMQKRIAEAKIEERKREAYRAALNFLRTYPALRRKATSFAPIRSRPRRTYDLFADEFSPEGSHAPISLARFLKSSTLDK